MFPAHGTYPLWWSKRVTYALVDKYARASDLVTEYLGITYTQVAVYLSKCDPVYAQIRQLIHDTDIALAQPSRLTNYPTLVEYLIANSKRRGWERVAGRLTAIKKQRSLLGQGTKGEAARGEAS